MGVLFHVRTEECGLFFFFLGGGSRGCCPSLFTVLHIIVLSKVLIDSLFFPCFSLISRRISKVLWMSMVFIDFPTVCIDVPWFSLISQWISMVFVEISDFHWFSLNFCLMAVIDFLMVFDLSVVFNVSTVFIYFSMFLINFSMVFIDFLVDLGGLHRYLSGSRLGVHCFFCGPRRFLDAVHLVNM